MFRYRIFYSLLLAACALFYLFYAGYLAFFLLALAVILPVISWLFTWFAVRKTDVLLKPVSPFTVKGGEFLLRIVLKNSSLFPIAQAGLSFTCENALCGEQRRDKLYLPVETGAEQTAEYRMVPKNCGKITVELTKVTYYDYLGIFAIPQKVQRRAELFAAPQTYYPDVQVGAAENPEMESSTFSKTRPGDDPSEIFDIRPYRGGDSLRRIHWKLSSKLGDLMVKEFSQPTDSAILLLAELTAPDMEALDTLLEALTSISRLLLEQRIPHSVGWYDSPHGQYCESRMEEDEDLTLLLNALLSARRYHGKPYALLSSGTDLARNRPRVLYLTGILPEALKAFCSSPEREGHVTVLYCGKEEGPQAEIAASLRAMQTEVIDIPSGQVQDSLSGTVL